MRGFIIVYGKLVQQPDSLINLLDGKFAAKTDLEVSGRLTFLALTLRQHMLARICDEHHITRQEFGDGVPL